MKQQTPIHKFIKKFLSYLRHEKRYSPNTLLAYQIDLYQFGDFILDVFEEEQLEEVSYSMIRQWVVQLTEKGTEASSVNRKLASLRSFYKFCAGQEIVIQNPTRKIKTLKVPRMLPCFVSPEDMSALLDQYVFEDTFEGWQDRVILELLYGTGMRRAELINLKETDIDLQNRTLKVLGKRNKERIIPFPEPLSNIIIQYWEKKKHLLPNPDSEYLLVTCRGDPLYPMLVYRRVKKYLDIFSSIEKRSPHVLRHTFATHMLNEGAEINAVKDLMGHSSLASTQVYTHNTIKKLKKAFDLAHPKA